MSWNQCTDQIHACLNALSIRDAAGQEQPIDQAYDLWKQWTIDIRQQRRIIYLIGNGASASMASHLSADLAKNAHVNTQVFSDLSLLTAIANDLSYEEVFAEPLRRRMQSGDLLVAISSSGGSPNILRAAEVARERGGKIVTLSAMAADNPLRKTGDLNIHIPAATYGMAESGHAAILHYWMDLVATQEQA